MSGALDASKQLLEDYPALAAEHLAGAQLFADRRDLVASLRIPAHAAIAEIGVSRGEFSEYLVRQLQPGKFVAFDTFSMHEWQDCWGTPTEVFLEGMTHLECFRNRLRFYGEKDSVEIGRSHETLARQPRRSFDLIYIDAQHDFMSVKTDAQLSIPILKPGGYLVFNDYVLFDHFTGQHYGVVQAVNDLVVNHGWRVAGFALEKLMFCDIAIFREAGAL